MDAQTFKHVLSHWASGVTVVTTLHEGTPIGITASAFSSVSVEPPLILVCLAQTLFTHQVIATGGVFAVNILSAHQAELGKRFAGLYPHLTDRFEGLATTTAATGCPLLPDVAGWLDCRVKHAYEGGDHTIFVGEVLAAHAQDDHAPLLYFYRQWGRFAALD
ncbi:flavin reductase family protein (plasmid) [Aggregatilineales bacterium SYSU G02658]